MRRWLEKRAQGRLTDETDDRGRDIRVLGIGPSATKIGFRIALHIESCRTLPNGSLARTVIATWLRTYPGVARWQERQAANCKSSGVVRTPAGRIYRFA
jgi:hypothetical protein